MLLYFSKNDGFTCSIYSLLQEIQGKAIKINNFRREMILIIQGLLDLDGRNSQKYLHQTWADF